MKTHGILVLLAVAFLMTAGGMTAPAIAPPPAGHDAVALAPAAADFTPADVCSAGGDMVPGEDHAEKVPPGCCSTQCNVDKDCNRICGKGVCACIQETPCCRRCVY